MSLKELLDRKEPILYVIGAEEGRVERELQRYCETSAPSRPLFRWSFTRGLDKLHDGVLNPVALPPDPDNRTAQAPLVAVLNYAVRDCREEGIFLLKDVHQFLRGSSSSYSPVTALTIRALRDAFHEIRDLGKPRKLVLLAPELVLPADLEKEVRVHTYPLPTKEELRAVVQGALKRAQAISQKDSKFVFQIEKPAAFAEALVEAALGLTQVEVECVLDNLLHLERAFTNQATARMINEKRQIIRKSGVLEFVPAEELRELSIGGLEAIQHWLRLRRHVFENRDRARDEYGIEQVPRGVLLVGISGCGKSLVCKKVASEWGMPLLRLDVGAIFDKWVGSSEDRMRRALVVAESIAPCVLWVDEIEKGFNTGPGGDGGTSSRVLGTFLVWMQEKKAPVFIAATANDITLLPPELLRAGRFDNRFFVGCPGDQSRREIFGIHLQKRKLNPESFDVSQLVEKTFGFTGAEIEQAVLDSAYDAFYENRCANTEDLIRNISRVRPLVKSMGKQMGKILEMLENGSIELASADTVPLKNLVDGLRIT